MHGANCSTRNTTKTTGQSSLNDSSVVENAAVDLQRNDPNPAQTMSEINEIHNLKSKIIELEHKNAILKIGIGLWDATFSKYGSFKANYLKSVPIGTIITDYETCSAVTKPLWAEEALANK